MKRSSLRKAKWSKRIITKSKRQRISSAARGSNDPIIRQVWDKRKTVRQNFSTITVEQCMAFLPATYDTSTLKSRLSEKDEIIMDALVAKHKGDINAMFRDYKLNKYQWTHGELKRKLEMYSKNKNNFH